MDNKIIINVSHGSKEQQEWFEQSIMNTIRQLLETYVLYHKDNNVEMEIKDDKLGR